MVKIDTMISKTPISVLCCPICQNPLTHHQNRLSCENNHSFDKAKQGYVNLHLVQHKRSKNPGDTPKSLNARRRFLANNHYKPLADNIVELLQNLAILSPIVLDIGCGEGYYTHAMADFVKSNAGQIIGMDIAKSAIALASKADKAQKITWAVATASRLPIVSHSVDICTSFFSPTPCDEIWRVLKPTGYLIVATANARHLYEMRSALFDTVICHNPDKLIDSLSDFELIQKIETDSVLQLDNQSLDDLITMTPYSYKAKPVNIQALLSKNHFETTASFCVLVFKPKQKSLSS